jgi:hypothetical protein
MAEADMTAEGHTPVQEDTPVERMSVEGCM